MHPQRIGEYHVFQDGAHWSVTYDGESQGLPFDSLEHALTAARHAAEAHHQLSGTPCRVLIRAGDAESEDSNYGCSGASANTTV